MGNYMSLSKKRGEELGGPGEKASCTVVWNLSDCRGQHGPPTCSVREPSIYQYLFPRSILFLHIKINEGFSCIIGSIFNSV